MREIDSASLQKVLPQGQVSHGRDAGANVFGCSLFNEQVISAP
jgi:hypothetical protein